MAVIEKIHSELLRLRAMSEHGFLQVSELNKIKELLKNSNIQIVKSGSFSLETSAPRAASKEDEPLWLLVDRFKVPYNPNLGFDWLFYSEVRISDTYKEKFPSQALPVRVIKYSPGFEIARSVAIFPENFLRMPLPVAAQPVYYFMDKFANRWFQITVPAIIKYLLLPMEFESLLYCNKEEILSLAATWVLMHEHFHEQGPLPIRRALQIKSSRSSAALEELRVDLEVIRNCLDSATSFGKRVAHFVFLERLLRYQIEGTAKDDYDARGSVALLRHLLNENAISIENSRIAFDLETLWLALDALLTRINLSEHAAAQCSRPEEASRMLKSVIDEYFVVDSDRGNRRYDMGVSLSSHSWRFA